MTEVVTPSKKKKKAKSLVVDSSVDHEKNELLDLASVKAKKKKKKKSAPPAINQNVTSAAKEEKEAAGKKENEESGEKKGEKDADVKKEKDLGVKKEGKEKEEGGGEGGDGDGDSKGVSSDTEATTSHSRQDTTLSLTTPTLPSLSASAESPILLSNSSNVVKSPRSKSPMRLFRSRPSSPRPTTNTQTSPRPFPPLPSHFCPSCLLPVENGGRLSSQVGVFHNWCFKCSICEVALLPDTACSRKATKADGNGGNDPIVKLFCVTHFADPDASSPSQLGTMPSYPFDANKSDFLFAPRINKESKTLDVGFAEAKGKRQTMEDAMTLFGQFRGQEGEDFIGLYDGHGGRDASSFASQYLHKIFADSMASTLGDVKKSFETAFKETSLALTKADIFAGTTASVIFTRAEVGLQGGVKLYFAHAGDSRIVVLWRSGKVERLTQDHKPDLPSEKKRIEGLGGKVKKGLFSKNGRVEGVLSVSRALGDSDLQPYVSSKPDVGGPIDIGDKTGARLLIIACDGLWDVVSDAKATQVANAYDDPTQAAQSLVQLALKRNSKDNVSVVVVRVKSNPGAV